MRYRHGGDNRVLCQALFEQWRAQCYMCEHPARFVDTEIDHILPRTVSPDQLAQLIEKHDLPADFDVDSPANLAPVCSACNRRKSDRRLTGTAVTVVLQQAREKQDRVASQVTSFLTGNRGWSSTVAVDQLLTSPEAAATRIKQITERALALDETWRLDVHTGPDVTTLRYTPKSNIVAERGGLPPLFDLSADDDGAREVARHLAAVQDFGGEVCVPARYLRPAAGAAEPSYAELLEVTGPDDQVSVLVGLSVPDPSMSVQLVRVSATGAVRRSLALHADVLTVGDRGARLTLRDTAGLFTVGIQAERPEHGGSVTGYLRGHGLPGRFPYRLREIRAFVESAEPTDRLEIRLNDQVVGEPDIDAADLGRMLAALRYDTAVVAALDRVQAHTGDRFPIPTDISLDERTELLLAARLLDGEHVRLTGEELILTLEPELIEPFLQATRAGGADEVNLIGPEYAVRCGSHTMLLGSVLMSATRARLVNPDEIHAAAGTGTSVQVRYDNPGDNRAFLRLLAQGSLPDDIPAEPA